MNDTELREQRAAQLDRDSEALHEAVQALIRNGAPSHLVRQIQVRRDEYAETAEAMRKRNAQ